MSKILAVGNALIDIMVDLHDENLLKKYSFAKGSQEHVSKEVFDAFYQELSLEDARFIPGGSAANVVHPLANLGFKTGFIGAIGNDELGQTFEEDLKQAGVFFSPIRKEGDTGKVLHLQTRDGEKTIIAYSGVNDQLTTEELSEHLMTSYTHLVLDGFLLSNEELVQELMSSESIGGMKVIFDMASSHIAEGHREFLKRLIKNHVDILFANDLEAFSYTSNEPERGIRSMAKDCEIVVIKQGSRGSMIQKGSEFYMIASAPARVVDSTGAGDMYAAGFLYGLLKNYHLTHCGKIASFLASKVLEVEGARLSFEKWREIKMMV
jgi:sugar/nucleoside kinase (ribokinase family)